jgi:negative regulator of flagellin synthesis FlgM
MQIFGPTHVHGPQPINAPHRATAAQPSAPSNTTHVIDQLDISHEADEIISIRDVASTMAQEIQQGRAERIEQIRAEIAAGTYETDEKLDFAIGQLLDEIG